MAKKTTGKLSVRKETLRQLGASQLARVAGGLASGINCIGEQNTGTLGSTLPSQRGGEEEVDPGEVSISFSR